MSVNILDLVKQALPADFVSKFSTANNESEADTQNGLKAIIPTLLLELSSLPKEKFGGIWDIIKGFIGSSSTSTDTTTSTTGIGSILSSLFGDKLSGIVGAISSFTNLKPSSTQGLLNAVTPVTLNAVGSHVSPENPSGVLEFLKSQKDHLLAAIPTGLSLGSLGLNAFKSAIPSTQTTHQATTTHESEKSGGGGFVKVLIALIILAALIYFFAKGCKNKEAVPTPTDTTTNTHDSSVSTITSLHESIKVTLPNGQQLDAYKGGIEDQLVTFLKSDYKKLGVDSLKNIWFNFDNLNFETGSDKITDSSQVQINNIVAILKAFPTSKIKIGGYTDKTGDEAKNLKLSKERAEAVKNALDKAGVSAQVTGADGYGSQYAKFAADAPESDRVNDRHVSVSVRE